MVHLAGPGLGGENVPDLGDGDRVQQYVAVTFSLNRVVKQMLTDGCFARLCSVPPSANITLHTPLNFGVLSPPKRLGEVLSPIDEDLCTLYI